MYKIAHVTDTHQITKYTNKEWRSVPFDARLYKQISNGTQKYDQAIFTKALKKISNEETHHLIHTGDIGDIGVFSEHEKALKRIKTHFKPAIPQDRFYRVFTICPGNHDYYRKKAFVEDPFMNTFSEASGGYNFPYIKVVGGFIALIVLRTRHWKDRKNTAKGSILKWEIKRANEHMETLYKRYPNTKLFKILMMHHSPVRRFPTEIHEYMGTLPKKYRKRVQRFINKHNVDMCVTGHTHNWKMLQKPKKPGNCLFVDAGSTTLIGKAIAQEGRPGYCVYTIDPEKGLVQVERETWRKNKFVSRVIYSINRD